MLFRAVILLASGLSHYYSRKLRAGLNVLLVSWRVAKLQAVNAAVGWQEWCDGLMG